MGLDVGDIIEIDLNDTTLPFAGSSGWDDYLFMITSVQRTIGKLKITAREV